MANIVFYVFDGIHARPIIQKMEQMWVDAVLDFEFEGPVQGHRGKIGILHAFRQHSLNLSGKNLYCCVNIPSLCI